MDQRVPSDSPYRAAYRLSLSDPAAFWGAASTAIDWIRKPTTVLDSAQAPAYSWFTDGTLNVCYNALDRHVVRGRADQPALIYDSPLAGEKRTYTYAELLEQTASFAGVLQALGVTRGDRVLIYLPMIPEAVIAMLACARIGAVHSVVFGGFASAEVAARIDDAAPSVIVTASCGLEPNRVVEYKPLVDEALALAQHQVEAVIVKQRPQAVATLVEGRDLDWNVAMRAGRTAPAACVEVAATEPLYILYTSGTTGKPKGIVRDTGGHAVAMAWSMPHVYGVGPGDVWWAASDVGWVVGHSYIVYGPLISGATTVLYEGKPVGTPDAGAWMRVISEHRVRGMLTAPTAIRAIRKLDPSAEQGSGYDISCLKNLFLAGERLDPDTQEWATEQFSVPVIDNWWQTETGWPIVANLRGLEPLPIKAGSPSVPVPGFDVVVLDKDGTAKAPGEEGAICLRLPLPPGALTTIWGDHERYLSDYLGAFDGYYLSGDGGYLDQDGYVYVMGRTDDVINVAGHRLTTGSIEAVLASHRAVAECAVIAVADALKGQVPLGLVVLAAGNESARDEIPAQLVKLVRTAIGPVAAFKDVRIVAALPKTRSGKILRKTMREIADGGDPPVPSTIEDRAVLDEVSASLRAGAPGEPV